MELIHILKRIRRQLYGLRALVPGLRRQHQLERMVGPLGMWDQLQAYQLNAVKMLGLQPGHWMLDIGCGPLQGGIAFIKYLDAGRYVGVDLKKLQINAAHAQIARLGCADKNPLLLVSDSFGDKELGAKCFDFIWLSQVLYYFDGPMMHRLFEMVSRRLNSKGVFAGDILGLSGNRRFIEEDSVAHLHTAYSLNAIASGYGLSVVEKGTIEQFGYPKRLGLRTNVMLQVTHRNRARG